MEDGWRDFRVGVTASAYLRNAVLGEIKIFFTDCMLCDNSVADLAMAQWGQDLSF
jgi:hypothetical protein